MMTHKALSLVALASAAWLAAPGPARADEDLVRRLPSSANAASIIRVRGMMDSPMGRRENWARNQQLFGAVDVPRTVEVIVTGTQWDPSSANRSWIIGLARLRQRVNMQQLATREQSAVETIAGTPTVLSRRNVFLVDLGRNTLGGTYPPDRGELVRWLRFASTSERAGLSPYLQEALKAEPDAQLVSAIDVQDLIDPRWLKGWLANSETMKGKPAAEAEAVAKLVAGWKGARLAVRIDGDALSAKLRLDFSEPIAAHEALVKPLALEAMEDLGALLEDFREAKVAVEGSSATLSCPLSRYGMVRLLTLLLAPTLDLPPEEARIDSDPALLAREASVRYWRTINNLLDELRRKNQRARDYNRTATWHDTHARQIEQLPAAHVDPELLEFGARVAARLRALAASLRGVPVEVELLQAQKQFRYQIQPPGWSGWGGWGGWGWNGWGFQPAQIFFEDNFQQVRARQAEAILRDQENREKLWRAIEEDRGAVRLRMQQKHTMGFEAQE